MMFLLEAVILWQWSAFDGDGGTLESIDSGWNWL
jgi:hypothetical protein